MKRLIAVLIVFAVLIAGTVSYAADTSVTAVSTSTKTEVPQAVKDKVSTLKDLNQQSVKMETELKKTRLNLGGLFTSFKTGLFGSLKQDFAKYREARLQAQKDAREFQTKSKALNAQIKQAFKEKNKEKFNAAVDSLNQLKQQYQSKKAGYDKMKQDAQKQQGVLKGLKDKYQAVSAILKPYKDQAAEIVKLLKNQNDAIKASKQALKDAISSKDYTKAESILDTMIQQKKDIIANLTKLIDIKNKAAETLKAQTN